MFSLLPQGEVSWPVKAMMRCDDAEGVLKGIIEKGK